VRDLLAAEGPRSIDSMLLLLPCCHVLTVETLDGLVTCVTAIRPCLRRAKR
jgi:hypothetical protein